MRPPKDSVSGASASEAAAWLAAALAGIGSVGSEARGAATEAEIDDEELALSRLAETAERDRAAWELLMRVVRTVQARLLARERARRPDPDMPDCFNDGYGAAIWL